MVIVTRKYAKLRSFPIEIKTIIIYYFPVITDQKACFHLSR